MAKWVKVSVLSLYTMMMLLIMVLLLSDNTVKTRLVHLPVSVEQVRIEKLATLCNTNKTSDTDCNSSVHRQGITVLVIHIGGEIGSHLLIAPPVNSSCSFERVSRCVLLQQERL